MPPRTIVPDKGLVTSRPPELADEGTLSRADDARYRMDDPTLYKVNGRTAFNTTPEGSSITGVAYAETSVAQGRILIASGTTIRQAPAGTTGAFADLFTGLTAGGVLDAAHYDDHVAITNGIDRPRVYGADFPTGGLLGMRDNTLPPTIARDAGAGAGFILSTGRTIRYWVEERVKVGTIVVKRNASVGTDGTDVVVLTGDGSTDKPVITRPAIKNTDATHWALYATSTNGTFPIGGQISEVAIATATIADTRTGTNPGLPSGEAYQQVSLDLLGLPFNVARNAEPPVSSIFALFNDSLVSDDVANPEHIRWSFPGNIHAWPAVYIAKVGGGEIRASVQVVRRVGNLLIIALDKRIIRCAVLPSEDEDVFQPEREFQEINGALGCVGKQAGDTFTYPAGAIAGIPMFAYVSPIGVMGTDGRDWVHLSRDIDWRALVEAAQGSKFILRNDPDNFQLVAAYVPVGGTAVTRALLLNYHHSHIKPDGRLKVTGPVRWAGSAIGRTFVGGRFRLFTGRSDGVLYLEDEGITRPATDGGFNFDAELSERYLGGLGNRAHLRRVWISHTAGGATQTATPRLTARSAGDDAYEETHANFSLARREVASFLPNSSADAHAVRVTNSDSLGTFGITGFHLEVEHGGVTR